MKFEGVFEVFDLSVRRLANGNKLRVVLESPEDLATEKQIIEFRGDNVKVNMSQQEFDGEEIKIKDEVFEVFEIKCRRLRNGDKLRLVLECGYEKEKEIKIVKLRYDNVTLSMTKIQDNMFEEVDEDYIASEE
jgi:hypothetical protein